MNTVLIVSGNVVRFRATEIARIQRFNALGLTDSEIAGNINRNVSDVSAAIKRIKDITEGKHHVA